MATKHVLFVVITLFSSAIAGAEPIEAAGGVAKPCGTLQKFDGEVQILDPNRTTLLETKPNAFIPCGAWVSTRKGTALIQHRQKYEISLGSETFVEIFDRYATERSGDEQLVLYRGNAFIQIPKGSDEFWALTATARVKAPFGTLVLSYFKNQERAQLVALEGGAELYNRYEMSRSIPVGPGEVSGLDMDSLRVVPELAKAVPVSGLRETLAEFTLDRKWIDLALRVARARGERRFASGFSKSAALAKAQKKASPDSDRAPASMVWQNENAPELKSGVPSKSHGLRGGKGPSQDQIAQRLVGGVDAGDASELLNPKALGAGGKRRPQAVVSGDTDAMPRTPGEAAVRKKLIQELQAIQPDEP